jgi:hypothetical protein
VNDAQKRGEDPYAYQREDNTVDMRKYMRSLLRDGLLPAMREDLTLLRAFMRVFNLLEEPKDLMKDPRLFGTILASYNRRDTRDAVAHGPERDTVVAHLGRLAA